MRAPILGLALAVVIGVVAAPDGIAAQPRPRALAIDSLVGSDLFRFYCASCHGTDGKGAGPLAPTLRTPPADLTVIARRHGGQFPRSQITAYVSSEELSVVAHGPRTMPVWGPIFLGLDPSDVRTKMRIENLVSYIASMQAK